MTNNKTAGQSETRTLRISAAAQSVLGQTSVALAPNAFAQVVHAARLR